MVTSAKTSSSSLSILAFSLQKNLHHISYCILLGEDSIWEDHCSFIEPLSTAFHAFNPTLGEDTFTWTIMGANEVLMSCAGWLMVSASSTTSCRDRASSKILSISLWTSAARMQKHIAEQKWSKRREKEAGQKNSYKHLQDVHIIEWNSSCSFTKAGAGVGSLNDGPLTGVV